MPTTPTGGLEFLRENGAHRTGNYGEAPSFTSAVSGPANTFESDDAEDDGAENARRNWDFEVQQDAWAPISVVNAAPLSRGANCAHLRPERFIDGKDVGRTVAYILSPQGFPVPVRLSQIGAVALRSETGEDAAAPYSLCCESRQVEKVVSFMADLFPWEEVERFAAALQANGYRLLIADFIDPQKENPRDYALLQSRTRNRTSKEMSRMESLLAGQPLPPAFAGMTLVDGRLSHRRGAHIGVIKSHADTSYLHPAGWDVAYSLRPGERTPVVNFRAENRREFLTWYLCLARPVGSGPLDGIVRIELTRQFFEATAGSNFDYINSLSRFLCEARTRDSSYSRAAVTLHPIQCAEERLRARFESSDLLLSRFYKLTGL